MLKFPFLSNFPNDGNNDPIIDKDPLLHKEEKNLSFFHLRLLLLDVDEKKQMFEIFLFFSPLNNNGS